MVKINMNRAARTRRAVALSEPAAASLTSHILRPVFTSGRLILAVAGCALIIALDYNRVSLDIPLIAVFCPLILLTFVRKSSTWRQDRHEYQRKPAERHHQDMGRHYSRHH
jgi:hypothetical protein